MGISAMITISSTLEHHKKIVKEFRKFKEWAPFRNDYLHFIPQSQLDEPLSISLASTEVSELPMKLIEAWNVPVEIVKTISDTIGSREFTKTFEEKSTGQGMSCQSRWEQD